MELRNFKGKGQQGLFSSELTHPSLFTAGFGASFRGPDGVDRGRSALIPLLTDRSIDWGLNGPGITQPPSD